MPFLQVLQLARNWALRKQKAANWIQCPRSFPLSDPKLCQWSLSDHVTPEAHVPELPNPHFEIRVEGRRVKTFSQWGGGGGAGRAPNYPFSLLNAEAGKFAGCVSCRRENVLSVNSRQSPGLLLDYSCFDAFFASKSSRFVLLPLFTSLPSNSEHSLLACSPNNKASLLQEKSEYYVRMRGMECPAVGTQLSVVEAFRQPCSCFS